MTWTGVPGAGPVVTSTLKSTPASAEAELIPVVELKFLLLRVTSVRRPITADGRMTNTLPAPLLVLMPAFRLPMHKPLPVSPVHVIAPVVVSRVQLLSQGCPPVMLPLDCS